MFHNPTKLKASRKNITASLIAAGLIVAPAIGTLNISPAYADDGTPGTIQINKSDANASAVTYNTYKLFNATISANSDNVSDITYASDTVKTALKNAITEYNTANPTSKITFDTTTKTAQEAAELIKSKIASNDASAAGSFSQCLSKAVKASVIPVSGKTVTAGGAAVSLPDGYYLFADANTSNGKTNTAASSAIFAAVGGKAITVTEKTGVPTVTKRVTDDTGKLNGSVADSSFNQNVTYTLTGTMPTNIDSYSTYAYTFTDTLSAGLTLNQDVTVTIDGTKIAPSSYAVNYNATPAITSGNYASGAHAMTVSFTDLKSATKADGSGKVTLKSSSSVVVTYTAKLNKNAVIAQTGNPNQVVLEYSNNPLGTGTGKTTPSEVRDYTYHMKFNKVDNATKTDLAGAKFTITNSSNKYIAKNSSGEVIEQDAKYEWVSDSNGLIDIQGIDADTYTITETSAPANYRITAPFTITITPTYSGSTLTKLDATIGNNSASMVSGGIDGGTMIVSNKEVDFTVGNVKNVSLPITGQQGITLLVLAGGALVIGSSIAIARNRKKNKENEKDE